MPTYSPELAQIRRDIASRGHRAREIADLMGLHETVLSAILNGRRPFPEGFEHDLANALDRLDRAEAARQQVLAEEV